MFSYGLFVYVYVCIFIYILILLMLAKRRKKFISITNKLNAKTLYFDRTDM